MKLKKVVFANLVDDSFKRFYRSVEFTLYIERKEEIKGNLEME